MMQKDSKGRKESRALGGGAQGEEPGKEPGAGEREEEEVLCRAGQQFPFRDGCCSLGGLPSSSLMSHISSYFYLNVLKKNVYTVQMSWHPLWDQPADTSELLRVMS